MELSCSGTILNEIKLGKKAGILDLTQENWAPGELLKPGMPEAAKAAEIMGVHVRANLKMRDGFFKNDEEHQLKLIQAIRKYQPEVVLANALTDRHPDHGRAGQLIATACFLSGLAKIETKDESGNPQQRWRPKYILHYLQDWYHEPDLLVDISDVFEQRMEAIKAYTTQFFTNENGSEGPQTYISYTRFS